MLVKIWDEGVFRFVSGWWATTLFRVVGVAPPPSRMLLVGAWGSGLYASSPVPPLGSVGMLFVIVLRFV